MSRSIDSVGSSTASDLRVQIVLCLLQRDCEYRALGGRTHSQTVRTNARILPGYRQTTTALCAGTAVLRFSYAIPGSCNTRNSLLGTPPALEITAKSTEREP